jgi:hypothetical protein
MNGLSFCFIVCYYLDLDKDEGQLISIIDGWHEDYCVNLKRN